MVTEMSRAPHDRLAGARNLLLGCAGLRAGERVLLVVEPEGELHYHPSVAPYLAECVRGLGGDAVIVQVPPGAGPESVPASLLSAIGEASHTIFLNRIGDQLRFTPLPGNGTKVMSYTLDSDFLGSAFAVTSYTVWEGVLTRLVKRLSSARRYRITCPLGTDLAMEFDSAFPSAQQGGGFTVKNFPLMIIPPVPASGLSGKLVLSHALTSTYVHYYADSVLPLASTVTLHLENGVIVRMEGDPALVARASSQFARVAALFGGNQWALNSWHAGTNPFTFFARPALSDIDRWSSVAFGSPRYAHFHMCGPAPGDICGQIFDPTITFDDAVIWDHGRPAFLSSEDKRNLLNQLDIAPDVFEMPYDIGVSST